MKPRELAGHKGGSVTKQRHGSEHFRKIGRKGGKARGRKVDPAFMKMVEEALSRCVVTEVESPTKAKLKPADINDAAILLVAYSKGLLPSSPDLT